MKKSILISLNSIKHLITAIFIALFVLLFVNISISWSTVLFFNYMNTHIMGPLIIIVLYISICGFIYANIYYRYEENFGILLASHSILAIIIYLSFYPLLEMSWEVIKCNKDAVAIMSESMSGFVIFLLPYLFVFIASSGINYGLLNKKPK